MKIGPFLVIILNAVAISIIYITSWSNCHRDLLSDVEISDVPLQISRSYNSLHSTAEDDDEEYEYGDTEIRDGSDVQAGSHASKFSASNASASVKFESYHFEPSFLKWEATPVDVLENWEFKIPKYCRQDRIKDFVDNDVKKEGKVVVHFHMQVRNHALSSFMNLPYTHLIAGIRALFYCIFMAAISHNVRTIIKAQCRDQLLCSH